jgi:hypothetical protein
VFVEELSADPIAWVGKRFADIESVLADGSVGAEELGPHDVEALRAAGPAVVAELERQLAEVAAGRAGLRPDDAGDFVRQSWL